MGSKKKEVDEDRPVIAVAGRGPLTGIIVDLEERNKAGPEEDWDNCPRQEPSDQEGMLYPEQVSPERDGDRAMLR